jgi:hypothetical protein
VSRDERTYGGIRQKYDAWVETESARPERDRLRRVDSTPIETKDVSEMSRMAFAAIGFGIAAVLLALAGYAFYTADYYGSFMKDGAATGYTVVGVFLLIAGIGGLAAVWNHNFRALPKGPQRIEKVWKSALRLRNRHRSFCAIA